MSKVDEYLQRVEELERDLHPFACFTDEHGLLLRSALTEVHTMRQAIQAVYQLNLNPGVYIEDEAIAKATEQNPSYLKGWNDAFLLISNTISNALLAKDEVVK